jgi:hypothetical protein
MQEDSGTVTESFKCSFCLRDKGAFYSYAYTICTLICITEHYTRIHTYLPRLVAAAPTTFMAWLLTWLVETSESWKDVMLVLLQGL